ncbi:Uncharacterized protein BP5553_03033 [Venustampulla echinocandica]|uniref:Amino acid transporter n=1 Tax=Venustampulla echinocandica TaxID=2656787 RepID=A0A370TT56_9HELO|nr:Uncharacterized protein BP5553_03033 [Venustampulla echinocandica]RDL38693.1 Uncharacterized protein BP5553_03033 [Venustampulla echinocandica]
MAISSSDQDATLDNPFGHKAELKKKFGFFSMLGVGFVITGTWPAAASALSIALPSGGPVAILWGLAFAGLGQMAVALSLAEICSVYPTNGGQYEWVAVLSAPRYKKFLSYVCGWVLTASWWALAATGPSLAANLIIALIQLMNEGYVFKKWHNFLIYSAIEVGAGFTNAVGTAIIPFMGKGAFCLSVGGFVAISITLLACTAHKYQNASFVFGGFINTTGWNDGAAWLLGLLQGAFTLVAYDATVHLIEEMPNPRRDAPWTMVLAVATGTVTGFIFLMCVLFSVQDVDQLSTAAIGPIVSIFSQATSSNSGTAVMTAIIIIILCCSSTEVVTSSSRLTAAFARQGGLPLSNFFARPNKKLDLPLNAMFLTNGAVIILGLVYLGASSAFNAIVNACLFGLSLSYLMPLVVLVLRGRHILPRGEFALGKWGYPLNIFAIIFLLLILILTLFPPDANPTAGTMNFAIVAIGAVILLATVNWFIHGRKNYEPPVIHIIDLDPAINLPPVSKAAESA